MVSSRGADRGCGARAEPDEGHWSAWGFCALQSPQAATNSGRCISGGSYAGCQPLATDHYRNPRAWTETSACVQMAYATLATITLSSPAIDGSAIIQLGCSNARARACANDVKGGRGVEIAKADLAAVAEKRRRNATAVLAAITGWPGWASLFSPADDWVPYHLPMRCSSPEIAERYFDHLHRAGLAAERWPDLPPEISACSAARRLQQTILHLPCHQFLDTADLAVPWPALADSGPLA